MDHVQAFGDQLSRVEAHVLRVEQKVDQVIANGCAHRPDDLRRIEDLESWKTRGIIGIIILFAGMIGSFVAHHLGLK